MLCFLKDFSSPYVEKAPYVANQVPICGPYVSAAVVFPDTVPGLHHKKPAEVCLDKKDVIMRLKLNERMSVNTKKRESVHENEKDQR